MGRANNFLGYYADDATANAAAAARGWVPEEGWIYHETTNNVHKEWDGSAWINRSFHGNTLMVASNGGQYTTIAQAVAVAVAGDTIQIYPGTYAEYGLTATAGVKWIGMGDPASVIIAPAADGVARTILTVGASSTYENITFQVVDALHTTVSVGTAGTIAN